MSEFVYHCLPDLFVPLFKGSTPEHFPEGPVVEDDEVSQSRIFQVLPHDDVVAVLPDRGFDYYSSVQTTEKFGRQRSGYLFGVVSELFKAHERHLRTSQLEFLPAIILQLTGGA